MTTTVNESAALREALLDATAVINASGAARETLYEPNSRPLYVSGVVREVLRTPYRRNQTVAWRLNW